MPSYYPIIALMLTDGAGPADCFGLPQDPARAFELLATREGRRTLSFVLRKPLGDVHWKSFDRQVQTVQREGIGVVTFMDGGYPEYLRDIAQSPAILFYRGDGDCLRRRGVAIVGGRRASARGVAFTRSLSGDIAELGIVVVSGAARGIDTGAHRGVLDRGGKTVAVLGTGLDVPYPPGNVGLLDEIARSGCVVSEQLMGTPPLKHVFPRRNRLISGLSHAVVVVEAGERSGALITARWALEQGRDVGAVPGFPGDLRSRGSNALIKMGAFAVEGVADVLEAVPRLGSAGGLGPGRPRPDNRSAGGTGTPAGGSGRIGTPKQGPADNRGPHGSGSETESGPAFSAPPGLSAEARAVFEVMGPSAVDADTLARHLRFAAATVQTALVELELRGLVERDLSGAYHAR